MLVEFEKRHPARFFQFGISERNMVAAAAGMASCGLLPYIGTFASFAGLMCYENIRTDLAYPNMKVRVLATHAGIACGFFGTSHHATEDISAMRSVANLMVVSPADGNSAAALIRQTVDHPGPIYFRMSRGREEPLYPTVPSDYGIGRPQVLASGNDLAIAATGIMVKPALEASATLAQHGIGVTVLYVHTLKPFSHAFLAEIAAHHRAIVTVEEHNVEGGLGTLVQEAVASHGLLTPVYKHGLWDEFSILGPPNHLYEYYGLNAPGIAAVTLRVLELVDRNRFFGRDLSQPLWTPDDRNEVLRRVQGRISPKESAAQPTTPAVP
jgi:transketolase